MSFESWLQWPRLAVVPDSFQGLISAYETEQEREYWLIAFGVGGELSLCASSFWQSKRK